jgi:hypothetical protein
MSFDKTEQASKNYDAQEIIPAAHEMLKKMKGYFYSAIQKPSNLCSTLLDPQIKTSVFTQCKTQKWL